LRKGGDGGHGTLYMSARRFVVGALSEQLLGARRWPSLGHDSDLKGDRAAWTRLGQAAAAPCLDVLNLWRCTSPALVPPTSLRRSCPPMASARVFSSPLTRLQPLVRPLALSLSSSPRALHFVKTRQVPTDEQSAYDRHTTFNQPASPSGVFSVLCGASGK
jgi:hypothetical protein